MAPRRPRARRPVPRNPDNTLTRPRRPCPSCGSNTHSRSSSHLCPRRRLRPHRQHAVPSQNEHRRNQIREWFAQHIGSNSIIRTAANVTAWAVDLVFGRLSENTGKQMSTVKAKLNTHLRDADGRITTAIKDQVRRVNDITFHGAKVLTAAVLEELENGRPAPRIGQQLVLKCYHACSTSGENGDGTVPATIRAARDRYRATRRENFQWQSRK